MQLQQRQSDDIEFTITSVNPSPNSLEITACGPAGRYGNVFCSWFLEGFNGNRGHGRGGGIGFLDDGQMLKGQGVGLWHREGHKIVMKQLIDIDNGDQNLDVITMDMHAKTVLIRPYAMETNDS